MTSGRRQLVLWPVVKLHKKRDVGMLSSVTGLGEGDKRMGAARTLKNSVAISICFRQSLRSLITLNLTVMVS